MKKWKIIDEGKNNKQFISTKYLCFDLTEVNLKVHPETESLELNCFSTEGSSSIKLHKDSINLFNHLFFPDDEFEKKAFAIADKFCREFCIEK